MNTPLRVLIVEDNPNDAELTLRELRHSGFDPQWARVETEPDFLARIREPLDIILADFMMPTFTALRALELLKQSGLNIPFIIVSGTIGEETAVEAMRIGASDYLLKDRLARLGNAVRQAIDQKSMFREQIRMTTALTEAERKYRSIFENALEGIYQSTPDGRYITANPALSRMLGYDTPGELMASITDIATQLYVDPGRFHELRRHLDTHPRANDFESQVRRRDGKVISIMEQTRMVRNADGGVLYYEGICQDITYRKEMEEKFLNAQKMEAIGRLAGGIAHDFNNILTAINGFIELLQEQLRDNAEASGYVAEIGTAAQRASELTRQLMSVGRKNIMQPRIINVNEVIRGIENMLRRILNDDVELIFQLDESSGSIKADPGQIVQVILNLVLNAQDAMPAGGMLLIKTQNARAVAPSPDPGAPQPEGAYMVLTISDTGSGMSKETMDRIFEPFFTTKEVGKGTGLGLATSFGIVQQSGGFFSVDSEAGKGSSFHVHLPIVDMDIQPEAIKPETVKPEGGTETILIAEDEVLIRRLLSQILTSFGYTVLLAENGDEALRQSKDFKGKIDLVISDVIMPKLGGFALIDQIKQTRPDAKFILQSGYADLEHNQDGVVRSDVVFLQKPFAPHFLAAKIREILDAR